MAGRTVDVIMAASSLLIFEQELQELQNLKQIQENQEITNISKLSNNEIIQKNRELYNASKQINDRIAKLLEQIKILKHDPDDYFKYISRPSII